jgi:hypothetical protein
MSPRACNSSAVDALALRDSSEAALNRLYSVLGRRTRRLRLAECDPLKSFVEETPWSGLVLIDTLLLAVSRDTTRRSLFEHRGDNTPPAYRGVADRIPRRAASAAVEAGLNVRAGGKITLTNFIFKPLGFCRPGLSRSFTALSGWVTDGREFPSAGGGFLREQHP